ncbi:MAG TPA: hypothetical protein VID68_14035 [Solirubrobacteraceae bacterium]|jgi:hypothetical protein
MPETTDATTVLDLLWAAMDALMDAADRAPTGGEIDRRLEVAIRQCALAIIPAKEAAMLEEFEANRAVA